MRKCPHAAATSGNLHDTADRLRIEEAAKKVPEWQQMLCQGRLFQWVDSRESTFLTWYILFLPRASTKEGGIYALLLVPIDAVYLLQKYFCFNTGGKSESMDWNVNCLLEHQGSTVPQSMNSRYPTLLPRRKTWMQECLRPRRSPSSSSALS